MLYPTLLGGSPTTADDDTLLEHLASLDFSDIHASHALGVTHDRSRLIQIALAHGARRCVEMPINELTLVVGALVQAQSHAQQQQQQVSQCV